MKLGVAFRIAAIVDPVVYQSFPSWFVCVFISLKINAPRPGLSLPERAGLLHSQQDTLSQREWDGRT